MINGNRPFAWHTLYALAAVSTLMLGGAVSAQDIEPKTLLNCHPPSAASGKPSGAAKKNKAWDSQDSGAGIILPSAGSGSSSAAPSVQRHGLPVEVRDDYPPVVPAEGQKPKQ